MMAWQTRSDLKFSNRFFLTSFTKDRLLWHLIITLIINHSLHAQKITVAILPKRICSTNICWYNTALHAFWYHQKLWLLLRTHWMWHQHIWFPSYNVHIFGIHYDLRWMRKIPSSFWGTVKFHSSRFFNAKMRSNFSNWNVSSFSN